MPYTVTIVTTKPSGIEWWDFPPGSPNYIARNEFLTWARAQPGYISFASTTDSPDVTTNVLLFDTEANYTAYKQAAAQQTASISRSAYNQATGITSRVTAETT